MIKVASVVRDIALNSDIARVALAAGVLNLSAYAEIIHREVERRTKKKVNLSTVVIALARMRGSMIESCRDLIPKLQIEQVSIHSHLCEVAFTRSEGSVRKVQKISGMLLKKGDFSAITSGTREHCLIFHESQIDAVRRSLRPMRTSFFRDELGAITLHLSTEHIDTPNVIYALLQSLALKKINVVEIVSTFSELSFVVASKDLEGAFSLLYRFKASVVNPRRTRDGRR